MTTDFSWLNRAILQTAALLVPGQQRPQWLAEWKSELWYVLRRGDWVALWFCLGAFKDAMWVRGNSSTPNPRQFRWLQSPLDCVAWMALAVAAAIFLFFRGPCDKLIREVQLHRGLIFAHCLMLALALLILPATTSITLGDYPAARGSRARERRFHRWTFLGIKLALILPIVFCGTLDLSSRLSSTILQPHATLVGYVLALRWVLVDQKRRCPVCLRLLINPARIGEVSHTFLELYGTEFFCAKGHGLLHVPEIPASYSTQRWLDLDSSWSGLFDVRPRDRLARLL